MFVFFALRKLKDLTLGSSQVFQALSLSQDVCYLTLCRTRGPESGPGDSCVYVDYV